MNEEVKALAQFLAVHIDEAEKALDENPQVRQLCAEDLELGGNVSDEVCFKAIALSMALASNYAEWKKGQS